jgi:mitochondrial fission protein ELM1
MQQKTRKRFENQAQGVIQGRPYPIIWAVMGYRAGENSQILALANALELPFETKRLGYRKSGAVNGLLQRVTMKSIDAARSTPLLPPWPDLVISAGLRNEPVCRWIREQSGGRTRLVHIGRPWAPLENFDLVITTPQYRLPLRPNVLHNHTTLHGVTPAALVNAAERWAPCLQHLPKPRVAVVIGGNSGPYTFGPKAARRLGAAASRMISEHGGSLLVTTSSRTPGPAMEVLEEAFTVPAEIHRWDPATEDNPYYAFLELADAIIVTGDSIAMLSEACATRKPIYIFDLATGAWAMRGGNKGRGDGTNEWRNDDFRLSALLYRQLMRFGPMRLSRDIRLVHDWLVSSGHAAWLGEIFPNTEPPPLNDVQTTVERVRQLLAR